MDVGLFTPGVPFPQTNVADLIAEGFDLGDLGDKKIPAKGGLTLVDLVSSHSDGPFSDHDGRDGERRGHKRVTVAKVMPLKGQELISCPLCLGPQNVEQPEGVGWGVRWRVSREGRVSHTRKSRGHTMSHHGTSER